MSTETIKFKGVSIGGKLPEVSIELTPALIIGGAIASRDFNPVHHDKAHAQSQGLPDVIMNILTTNGLVGRYVTDWAGPNAIVKNIAIKLGAPNMPGDTMKMKGTIKAKDESDGTVEVDVVGSNAWGHHVTGTVKVALPTGE